MCTKTNLKTAVGKIPDGATVALTGFGGSAIAEYLVEGIEASFLQTGHPKDLTITHAAGIGDGGEVHGVNHLAHEGLIRRYIGAHYNLAPKIQKMVDDNKVEAYVLPQGTLTQLYREIGSGRPGVITKVGLGTFVDPRQQGGRGNALARDSLVEVTHLGGEEYLWYKSFDINAAVIRATSADENGNLTVEKESTKMDQLCIAQAAKHCGGVVIAQVERIVASGALNPRDVAVPGILVDYVVVAPADKHMQYFDTPYDGAQAQEYRIPLGSLPALPMSDRKIIARRAAMELTPGAVINLGIGIPEGVSSVAVEEGISDKVVMTVESGHVGGVPSAFPSFGGCYNPEFVNDMTRHFDFYDGGGLDMCFLGAAEIDAHGNVNVSKFKKTVGPGGFINIAQSSGKVIFCGTLTAGGLTTEVRDGKLVITNEGRFKKFVKNVQQITYSGEYGSKFGQYVLYVTERAVFKLERGGIVLTEIAPGIDLKTQVLPYIDFPVQVSKNLKEMDAGIFKEEKMGLKL